MLKIRLKRMGRKSHPVYRIVVMESLTCRDGKSIVDLGFYDPIKKICHVKKFLLQQYINNGAYPTDTVRHLINKFCSQELN
jgi:small subunit ribosomal protein S16